MKHGSAESSGEHEAPDKQRCHQYDNNGCHDASQPRIAKNPAHWSLQRHCRAPDQLDWVRHPAGITNH
jgi:hypothetical protein